jgi:hypothetical protein
VSVTLDARTKEREYAYPDRRAWLVAVIADAVAGAPDGAALDVASSYAAAFHPVAAPAMGHDYRLPDGTLWHDGTYAQLPRAEEYEDNDWGAFRGADDGRARTDRPMIMLAPDAGGFFVRDRDGRIVRDRREVSRLLRHVPDFQRFALALLPEPAALGRKRAAPWTIARALLFADLQPALGTRPAARQILTWEDQLGAPWRIPGAAGLVSRFDAGGELGAEERRALRIAEQTMIRSCRRGRPRTRGG